MTKNIAGSDYYVNLEMACKGDNDSPIDDCIPNYKTLKLETDYLDPYVFSSYKEAVMTLTFEYPTVMEMSHFIVGTRTGSHIFMDISAVDAQGNTVSSNFKNYYPIGFIFPNLNQSYDALLPGIPSFVRTIFDSP